ncbi:urokinase plasminogen activator surface receptor-like [Sardina pilchardus]|uniref:urokinase plasminogen activator surface receptor-like n=1 Tax=Sardina pilchardus TaxID=27697 RepID=UPI002E114F7C
MLLHFTGKIKVLYQTKMGIHLLFITFSCLFSGARSLSCNQCMPEGPGPCKDTKMDCPPPMTQCGSLRVLSSAGGQVVSDMNLKSCVMPQQCMTGSLNVGMMKTVINSKCCSSNYCNAAPAEASTGGPNGKECYTCSGSDCSGKMKCEGVEDRCITGKMDAGGQKMTLKGCASKSICSGEMKEQLGEAIGDMTCCEGNLCNGDNKGKSRSGGGTGRSSAEVNRNSIAITVLSVACFLFLH